MSSTLSSANQLIINKYCWMARKLRLFNDSNSISQWCNAMASLKKLHPHDIECYRSHSSNPYNRSPSIRRNFYSVSKPTTLSFPSTTIPNCILTPSTTPPLHFAPQEPSPLSIHHPQKLSIHPVPTPGDLQMPLAKKRKTLLPPQVDCTSPTPPKIFTSTPSTYPHAQARPNPTHQADPRTVRGTKSLNRSSDPPIFKVWDGTSPPPKDEVYKREFALLQRDAAKAGIPYDIYVNRH